MLLGTGTGNWTWEMDLGMRHLTDNTEQKYIHQGFKGIHYVEIIHVDNTITQSIVNNYEHNGKLSNIFNFCLQSSNKVNISFSPLSNELLMEYSNGASEQSLLTIKLASDLRPLIRSQDVG